MFAKKACLKLIPSIKPVNSFAVILALLGLSGCGGTGQDDGSPSNFSQQFSGVVVDGYLARATVFIDSNNNGTRDAWEPWAFTDNDGYYSYNPNTETDYCRDDASEQEAQYCLVADVEYSSVVIRIDSGYDVVTGEPFLGQMSRRVNAQVAEEVSNSVVSPITSLLTNVDNSSDRTALLDAMNIEESDLDVDYLNTDGAGSVDPELLGTALKIHKVVAVLSDRLTDTYTEIGEDFGTPNDASSAVYPNLAEQIIASGSSLDNALSDENNLVAALDAAETQLREVYDRKEFDLPADMGDVSNPGEFNRIIEVASEFSSFVNTVINVDDENFSMDDATAGSRALETLVIKTVEESTSQDSSIDNMITFFEVNGNGEDTEELTDTLLASLAMDSADISALSRNDFAGDDFDSVEEIAEVAALREDILPFTRVGGLQVRVSDLDLGTPPTSVDDSEVEFYFRGAVDDIEGAFSACVKYIDDANLSTGELGDGNTKGELVEGFWSLLGATEDDVESYSLLITLTLLGTTYQAIIKPAGFATIDDTLYYGLRFDNNDEFETWYSGTGFLEFTSVPESNEECRERLPSRVGL